MEHLTSRLLAGVLLMQRQRWLAVVVTLAIFVVAMSFRYALDAFLPTPYPFLVIFPVIGFATFFGGVRMGLLVVFLAVSLGLTLLALLPPPFDSKAYAGLAYFAFIALSTCYVVGIVSRTLEENLSLVGQLRAAIRRTEAATALKTRMMARIGHDLKLPLQTIVGTLDILWERRRDEAERADFQRAHRAVAQQLRALDNLLEASRLELGQRHPAPRQFAIADALAAVAEDCVYPASRKGLRFRSVASSAVVVTDYDMLMTILRNLAGNAVKYTRRGGGVVVGVRRHGERLRIDVVDSGVGIASEQLGRVFDEFFQETQQSEGVGLGLAIVKETAHLLNCPIEADSQPGRGTRFSIFVPCAAQP